MRIAKLFVAFFVGVSLFYFVVRETGIETIWEASSLFFGWEGAVILAITLLVVFIGGLRWREVLRSEGEEVSLLLTTRYLIKGFTVDFLTPFSFFGGETVRIFLMEKEVGIKKSAFSSITDKIMDVTAHFSFLILGVIFFIVYGTVLSSTLLLFGGAVILLIFLALFLFYGQILRKKSFLRFIFDVIGLSKKYLDESENGKAIIDIEEKIIFFFTVKKKELAKGMAFSFLRHFLFLLRVFLIIFFITGTVDFGVAIIAYGLVILSMLLPIPAAIGGMEVFLALGFNALGIGLVSGVAAAIALRGADLVVCAAGIIFFICFSLTSFYKNFSGFLKRIGSDV